MKRILCMLLVLATVWSMTATAFAANERTMTIPVTVSVVHTSQSIDVTLPAALPVSVVDGYVYTADNLAIRNNSNYASVRITGVSVTGAAYTVASYARFPSAQPGRIALRINGCETASAGALSITTSAFPTIVAGSELAIRYDAKVSDFGEVSGVKAANVVFTLKAV